MASSRLSSFSERLAECAVLPAWSTPLWPARPALLTRFHAQPRALQKVAPESQFFCLSLDTSSSRTLRSDLLESTGYGTNVVTTVSPQSRRTEGGAISRDGRYVVFDVLKAGRQRLDRRQQRRQLASAYDRQCRPKRHVFSGWPIRLLPALVGRHGASIPRPTLGRGARAGF